MKTPTCAPDLLHKNVTQDEAGLKKLFTQFSFPDVISSHVTPTTPGSIDESGELGYSLSHAFGTAFDNTGLIVASVIGDGEAGTSPLATAWQSNKLLDPITDGAVLPIVHLNAYKSAPRSCWLASSMRRWRISARLRMGPLFCGLNSGASG